MRFLTGLVFGVLLVLLGLVVLLASGSYNVAALSSPSKLEKRVAAYTLSRSIARRAPSTKNPFAPSKDVLTSGLAHYKENCVTCHGAPGVEESEAGMGLNPPAPDLTLPAIQKMSDGELFWVVSNGVRMTGMPAFSLTHKPDEIWTMVAFLRHLPELTEAEQKQLKAGSEEAEHHREDAGGGKKEGTGHEEAAPSATPVGK